jgi:hypothetical protein
MEYIKKVFKQILTTGTTFGTTSGQFVIIPNTGVTYNFNVLLSKDNVDLGFYDVINDVNENNDPDFNTNFIVSGYTVTGTCVSRLNEIKKNAISPVFYKQYFYSIDTTANGLDVYDSYFYTGSTLSNPISILSIGGITGVTQYLLKYYIDKIKYIEYSGSTATGTTFSFVSDGLNNPDNFNYNKLIKDENKNNVINNPEITSDVFILRQELSVFEKNYNLEYIKNLIDLETFAGGNYYNIVKNS